jgi:hypothetical protein
MLAGPGADPSVKGDSCAAHGDSPEAPDGAEACQIAAFRRAVGSDPYQVESDEWDSSGRSILGVMISTAKLLFVTGLVEPQALAATRSR